MFSSVTNPSPEAQSTSSLGKKANTKVPGTDVMGRSREDPVQIQENSGAVRKSFLGRILAIPFKSFKWVARVCTKMSTQNFHKYKFIIFFC